MPFPSPGRSPNPGIKPKSPTLQADSLPSEPQGKPKNTEVGNLFPLQWVFLTQELNQDLLHSRQILYQLSYQGSQILYVCAPKSTVGGKVGIHPRAYHQVLFTVNP